MFTVRRAVCLFSLLTWRNEILVQTSAPEAYPCSMSLCLSCPTQTDAVWRGEWDIVSLYTSMEQQLHHCCRPPPRGGREGEGAHQTEGQFLKNRSKTEWVKGGRCGRCAVNTLWRRHVEYHQVASMPRKWPACRASTICSYCTSATNTGSRHPSVYVARWKIRLSACLTCTVAWKDKAVSIWGRAVCFFVCFFVFFPEKLYFDSVPL